jgi:predicted AlkP superfamily pyrophosphatase or phosphodiesterase
MGIQLRSAGGTPVGGRRFRWSRGPVVPVRVAASRRPTDARRNGDYIRGMPLLLLLAALVTVMACARPSPSRREPTATSEAHSTILLSLDGYRADYLQRPNAVRLRELAARGTRLERLVPVFPTKTFPNHYTIVTGLYPEQHGIIANTMYDHEIGHTFTLSDTLVARDPRWWGGDPIWNTAERQGVKTAAMFWPGSDYEIGGRRPSWYTPFNNRYPDAERITKVLSWLDLPARTGPRLMTLYYSATDDAGHSHGPASPQVDTAIGHVDRLLGTLIDGIAARGLTDRVNLIVVSDHGMVDVDTARLVFIDDVIDLQDAEIVDWSPVTAVTPRAGKLEAVYAGLRRAPHVAVYRKDSVPARFHYRAHPRITPLVLVADEGWTITTRARAARNRVRGGTHGFDNALPSMGALFVAAGPDIAPGRVLPPVANIHVYELLSALLGVKPAPNDGSPDSLRAVLRR